MWENSRSANGACNTAAPLTTPLLKGAGGMANHKSIPAGLCQCGCGQRTTVATKTFNRRGFRKGEFCRFVSGHTRRTNPTRGSYRSAVSYGRKSYAHVAVAEAALGKRLPKGAEVHHVDGDRTNDENTNLVICQNRAYHQLLHVRARVLKAGGDPNTQRICSTCQRPRDFSEFTKATASKVDGLGRQCRRCRREYMRAYDSRRQIA